MATLNDLVTRVADRCNKNSTDTTTKARLIRHINKVCQENWDGNRWSFRWQEYYIPLIADVTTGTLTATNGSKTLTASSAIFDTTNHKGAFVRFLADNPNSVYRIQNVISTTSVTIEPAYQGTTGSSKTYELKKTDYLFPAELLDTDSVTISCGNSPFHLNTFNTLSINSSYFFTRGLPTRGALYNQDFKGSTYTATLSASSGSRTITGSGSAFLTNVTPGDTLTDGTYTYTVYSIESDTSLTLYNYTKQAITSGSFTFSRSFGRNIRLLPSADLAYVAVIKGLRKYAPLVSDSDVNEMTLRFPGAIEESAVRLELGSSPDHREAQQTAISESWWQKARAEDQMNSPKMNTNPLWSPRC